MKPDIDLTRLTEDELIALNRRVVERLRFIRQARTYQTMAAFNVGDIVSFTPEAGRTMVGTVVRLNQKTATVCTREGERWRVAPSLLSRTTNAESVGRADVNTGHGQVVLLHELPGKNRHGR
jgi:hypothetical protein